MNVEFLDRSKFENILSKSLSDIKKINSVKGDSYSSSSTTVRSQIQKYILSESSDKHSENIVKPMILDAVFKSENIAQGGGELCLNLFSENFEKFIKIKKNKGADYASQCVEKEFKIIANEISKNVVKFRKKHIDSIIESEFQSKIQKKIAQKIIDLSNPRTRIIVEKSNRVDTLIKVKEGYTFKINPSSMQESSPVWRASNVNTIVIDGMIENISEIHHLLDRASSTKEPYVIFSRNASDDVRNTIMINNARGTINVSLVEVGFDENTLNILNDISICCDSKIVSSNFGDLISTAVKEDMVIVDHITVSEREVIIKNKPDQGKLKSHIEYLNSKKRIDRNIEVSHLFESRIRSLTSDIVLVEIGHSLISRDPGVVEKFDRFLRNISAHMRNDTVQVKLIDRKEVRNCMQDSLKFASFDSIYFSLRHAFSLIKSLILIEGCIANDKH